MARGLAPTPAYSKALDWATYATRWRENVIVLGNSGTGKTHIALGLGLTACQRGVSVGFNAAAALVHKSLEARDEKRLLRLQKQLAGYRLTRVHDRLRQREGHAKTVGLMDSACGSLCTTSSTRSRPHRRQNRAVAKGPETASGRTPHRIGHSVGVVVLY